ncbi:MAG: hypothetical protein RL033_7191, partial [Pseudomonadota bacterium]
TCLPLVILVREGPTGAEEVEQLSRMFERRFASPEAFAVLSVAHRLVEPPDAIERHRLAAWGNRATMRTGCQRLCVGWATVAVRDAERRALTALLWLWKPSVPHESASTVPIAIDYCLSRLKHKRVALPSNEPAFRREVLQGLASLPIAGIAPAEGDRALSAAGRRFKLEVPECIETENGRVQIGWLSPGVLWAAIQGQLSVALGLAYAERLRQFVARGSRIAYFLDASRLSSFELTGRTTALKALVEHREQFSSVRMLNWSGGGPSPTARALLQPMMGLLHIDERREDFERALTAAAPSALAVIGRLAADADSEKRPFSF